MRILQVHNRYGSPGGEDTIAQTEAELLEADGHAVDRFCVTNPTHGLPAVANLLRSPRNTPAAEAVARRVRRWRAEVAHVHNTWFSLSPEIFHRLHDAGVPIVMTLQNYRLLCANAQLFRDGRVCTDCVGRSPWPGVVHRCYRGSVSESALAAATIGLARVRRSFDLIDRFLAPSEFVRQTFVGAGFDPSRIVTRHNVIDDPGPRPSRPSTSATILYAGRLSAEKGLPTLLDGWARSALAGQGYTLKLIGDGPLRPTLETVAPPGVRFAGWVPPERLRAEMHTARTLVFPSEWYENFGRVIIEALAAGLPVLASDIASPAEIVGFLGDRWLVPPGDPAAWGSALGALTDATLVDAGGARARWAYEERFSLERGLQSLLAVYREVASVRPTS